MVNNNLTFSNLSILASCPPEILQDIHSQSEILSLRPREILATANSIVHDIFIVLHGSIKLQSNYTGKKEVIYHFLSRGDIFGASIELEQKSFYPSTAMAIDNCGVLKIPFKLFTKLLRRHPPALHILWQQMSKQLIDLQKDRETNRLPINSRLAELLLRMLRQQSISQGNRIMTKLSRKDLAAKLGTESETIVRILSEWKKNGWIKTENKFVDIIDLKSIESLI